MGDLDDGKATVFGGEGNDQLWTYFHFTQWTDFSGGSGFGIDVLK